METTAYDIALIGGGFAIIGALISYWTARWLTDRNNIIIAKAKLRAAFAGELAAIRLASSDIDVLIEIRHTISKSIMLQASSIEEFRPFVAPAEQEEYQQAWQKYYNFAAGIYAFKDGQERKILPQAKELIDHIMTFSS